MTTKDKTSIIRENELDREKCRKLIRKLQNAIEYGDAIERLHAGLLLQQLIDREPEFAREYQKFGSPAIKPRSEFGRDDISLNAKLAVCHENRARLNDKEQLFVMGMIEVIQRFTPTPKQQKWIEGIYQRLTKQRR
jgi:hypothetical protein